MTAPNDAGATYYRLRRRWRLSRWHPVRLLSTDMRRYLAVFAFMVAATQHVAADPREHPVVSVALLGVTLALLWCLPTWWTLQVDQARTEPTPPPEPVYTWILDGDDVLGDYEPRVIAGWDQVAAGIVDHARTMGLDVDDPYTLAVIVAAVTMPGAYAQTRPVTLEAAAQLYGAAFKLRARDLARRDETPAP